MKVEYSGVCLLVEQMYEYRSHFAKGINSVGGNRVVALENIAAVETIIKKIRRVTVNKVATCI